MPTRLPDPFTHPNIAPGFLTAPLVDNEPIFQDALPNGRVLELTAAAHFWSCTITYPDLLENEFRLVNSAVQKAKTGDGVIQLALPQFLNLRVTGDTETTSIAAEQTGSTLVITGAQNLTGNPYVGDLFQLKGEPKVYKITSVSRSSDNRTLTLGLYPNLVRPTLTTDKPEFNNILFNMKLSNRSGLSENPNADGLYTGVSLQLRESL